MTPFSEPPKCVDFLTLRFEEEKRRRSRSSSAAQRLPRPKVAADGWSVRPIYYALQWLPPESRTLRRLALQPRSMRRCSKVENVRAQWLRLVEISFFYLYFLYREILCLSSHNCGVVALPTALAFLFVAGFIQPTQFYSHKRNRGPTPFSATRVAKGGKKWCTFFVFFLDFRDSRFRAAGGQRCYGGRPLDSFFFDFVLINNCHCCVRYYGEQR